MSLGFDISTWTRPYFHGSMYTPPLSPSANFKKFLLILTITDPRHLGFWPYIVFWTAFWTWDVPIIYKLSLRRKLPCQIAPRVPECIAALRHGPYAVRIQVHISLSGPEKREREAMCIDTALQLWVPFNTLWYCSCNILLHYAYVFFFPF